MFTCVRHNRGQITAGIYGLEQNWVGPILENPSINATHALFKAVEQTMSVRLRWQWRLQQLMYRMNFDKFLQIRATEELRGERQALDTLRANMAADPMQVCHRVQQDGLQSTVVVANGQDRHVRMQPKRLTTRNQNYFVGLKSTVRRMVLLQ